MKVIKNDDRKTVCRADADSMTVEIMRKGYRTVIRFLGNGEMKVVNNQPVTAGK